MLALRRIPLPVAVEPDTGLGEADVRLERDDVVPEATAARLFIEAALRDAAMVRLDGGSLSIMTASPSSSSCGMMRALLLLVFSLPVVDSVVLRDLWSSIPELLALTRRRSSSILSARGLISAS